MVRDLDYTLGGRRMMGGWQTVGDSGQREAAGQWDTVDDARQRTTEDRGR